jgi:tRNA nucleotidyltransferase (CCA-adding enzyme)
VIEINEDVKKIMKLIESSGYEVYLVGGFVRDSIIGKENKDYDLCTNMPFDKLKEIIPEIKIMRENNHRNTCVFRRNNEDIEITMFRGYDLISDLINRDFTINAIALNSDGKVIDLLNGIYDINSQRIKLCDETGVGLITDPLRILRAIRFAGVFGFEIEENTWKHMLEKKELLKDVAVERIYNELSKILLCDRAGDLFSKYREILCDVVPDLKPLIGFEQNNPYHMYDVFDHTMVALNNTRSDLTLRYATLFHDVGKPECYTVDENGEGHFYGHPASSTKKFIEFADKIKMDKKSSLDIQKLIFFHDAILGTKTSSMNKFVQQFGVECLDMLFELKIADIQAQSTSKIDRLVQINELRKTYFDFINSSPVLSVKDLEISGKTLKQMDFDGKIIGVILRDVLDMVSSEKLPNDKGEIESYVSSKYR